MARPIKFKKPVAADAEKKPAIRVQFNGKDQSVYFGMREIADNHYDTDATGLGRLVWSDFVKEFNANPNNARAQRIKQLSLSLVEKPSGQVGGKKGESRKRGVK